VHRASSSIPVSDGPHITQLFVGDGGALGVKVQATLAIHPARTEVKAGGYFFGTFEQAWAAVAEMNRRADELPYAKLYVTKGSPWTLTYAVKAGSPEMLEHHVGVLERILAEHGGTPGDAELLESAQAIADLKIEWANQFIEIDRGAIAVVFGNREFPAAFARLRHLVEEEFADRLEPLGIEPIVFVSPYGRHGTWFGISLPYDPTQPGARDAVAAMTQEAYELVTHLGGYSEPHQGENSVILATAWSPAFRAFFDLLKDGVDPDRRLNGGLWNQV
jgi:FAD/FMN-containing dehydrogenase